MKKLMVLILTGVLVFGRSVCVLAEDRESVSIAPVHSSDEEKQVVVDGNVTGGKDVTTSISVHGNLGDNVSVEVKGDVYTANGSDGSAISSSGDAKVEVGGNVTGSILAIGSGKVKVGGNADGEVEAAYAGEANVCGNVNGDIRAESRGKVEVGGNAGNISAHDNASVEVGGNADKIIAFNNAEVKVEGDAVSAMVANGASVNIDGNVTGGVQINDGPGYFQEQDHTSVKVGGDVNGLSFDLQTHSGQNGYIEGKTGTAIVEGTVKESYGSSIMFGWEQTANNVEAIVYKTEGKIVELGDDGLIDATNRVFYIIKKDSDNVNLSGTIKKEGYDTAHVGDVVRITVADGYEASSTVGTIVKNPDGTYKITIPAGGGVTISAIKTAIEEMENNNQGAAVIEVQSEKDESSKSKDSANSTPASIPSTTDAILTGNTLSAKVDALALTESQYTAKLVDMVAQVPAGGTLSLDVTDATYLNEMIISALKIRSDVTVVLNVKYAGVDYTITIPAGYNLSKLLGADGKIDFAKLLATFGAKAK